MRRVLLLIALILAGAAPREPVQAQHIVVFDDYVRAKLAADWDKDAKNPYANERAYCVRYQKDVFADEFAYRVTEIEDAKVLESGTSQIVFDCPTKTDNMALLHTHPASTCSPNGKCELGGAYAYQCFSSPTDDRTLVRSHHKFGLIQCDRNAIISFWPDNILPEGEPVPKQS
jgi:hypothetical protein